MFTTEMIIMIAIGAASLLAIILSIIALCRQANINKKYRLFMSGRNGQSLENVILEKLNDIEDIKSKTLKNSEDITELFSKMEYAVCKVGMVKYDAFNEMGGKLSFALVMLDEKNNGFSMNSMHGQEGSYVYVKEIINGESYIALGEEEQKALKEALEDK